MNCSNCGTKNPDENSFCEACGTRLFVPPSNLTSYPLAMKTKVEHGKKSKKQTARRCVIATVAIALVVTVVLILTANPYEKTKLSDARCDYINVADDCIYYANDRDSGIYRMRLDGSENIKISDYGHIDFTANIYIIDDWIYYINDSGIYKMHTDGSEDTLLIESQSVNKITVADGWIYYDILWTLFDDGQYRMRVDGSENVKLEDVAYNSMCIENSWIYYASDGIYKVRTNGSGRTKLSDEFADKICVVDEWVYYMNVEGVYKIRTDGSEKAMLCDVYASDFSVVDSWVYYSSHEDGIFKTRKDGSERVILCNDDPYDIIVRDGWIYYYLDDYNDNRDGIYKIRTGTDTTDGNDMENAKENYTQVNTYETPVPDESTENNSYLNMIPDELIGKRGNTASNIANAGMVAADNEWIYYMDSSPDNDNEGSLYKMNAATLEKTVLGNGGGFINLLGDWIVYYDIYQEGICRMRTDGSGNRLLCNERCAYVSVVDGWVYYTLLETDYGDRRGIYRMRLDGSEVTRLASGICQYVNVEDGWIAYLKLTEDSSVGGYVYRVRVDGTDELQLTNNDYYTQLVIDDGWIYYLLHVEQGEDTLYRANIKGRDTQQIAFDNTGNIYNMRLNSINAADGWVYYYKIYNGINKTNVETGEEIKLTDEDVSMFYVVDDWIYYFTEMGLNRMRTDGSDIQPLYEIPAFNIDDYNIIPAD